ncbi:berberine bridge enzyme-like 17 [Arachis duranensis]|uniref:Berberine bridge enzyme-like 17 n=1 Tax=Arachis duranensis TaxID=130453 RepID=A0A6P4CRM9_ARADU|nr:berberine bridge enzyme-like 17 [Arachis duranensis]
MATSSSLPSPFSLLSTLLALTILLLQSPVSHANPDAYFHACLSNNRWKNPSAPVSVTGALYTRHNSSFSYILNLHIRNKRFNRPNTPEPIAIITPFHESHVQAAIICSKASKFQLRIRSGGHDYEGFSFISDVPFVLLDMYTLKSIHVNIQNGTALIEAGATLGQLYYKVARNSNVHAIAAGVCPSVGTGGHFSGGGYGNLMRKYGLSVDNIIDAKIVDVNGNILDRKSMGEDLFWAIRGGGGASFGVILSWTMKLVEVPPLVTVFKVNRTLEQGVTDLVYKWQHVAPKIDRDLFIRLQHEVHHKRVQVTFIAEFLGRTDRLLSLMKKNFPELGLTESDCVEMPWVNSTLFYSEYPIGTPAEALLFEAKDPAWSYSKSKSDYVKNVISKKGLQSIWNKLIESEIIIMQWSPYGGRMWEIPTSATPFPHRAGNLFKISYYITWLQDEERVANHNLNLLRSIYKFMTPFVSKSPREAFFNYRDRDIGACPSNGTTNVDAARIYGAKFFRENFDRLVQVKTRVDPENFFRYEQSIPPHKG